VNNLVCHPKGRTVTGGV